MPERFVWLICVAIAICCELSGTKGAFGAAGRYTRHTNLSGILGALMAYEYRDNRNLQFNQPASVIGATVTIQLLVEDYSQSHDSILPIPADMEAKVIEDTLKVLLVNRNVPVDKNNDDNDQR